MGSQWDSFGPEAQRSQQDKSIDHLGMHDVSVSDPSLDFRLAHSGRTVADSPEFNAMLSRAGTDFDVLVVGYISRFARDLRTAVNARHELHRRGAVIFFADEHLLSSDERRWKEWADEAVEAEAYSRKLGRRVSEVLEAKRLRLGEPGGRPPFGFTRQGRPPVLVEDPDTMPMLKRVFALAAQGLTDREVAETTGLKKKHVAELLTNRIYIGELRGGGRRAPVIDREVWEQVQAKRARHAHRAPGPVTRQPYVLSGMLHCRACGHSITGHSGRYRHEDGCARFRAARTEAFWDKRGKGDSYKAEVFDGVVPGALAHMTAGADLVGDVADYVEYLRAPVNELALQRIRRARDRATERLLRDRDTAAWNAEMKRLDAEEAEVMASAARGPTRTDVVNQLADLARLYDRARPETRQRIAQSVFARVEVLGPTRVWLHPSEEAVAQGWATAMHGEFTMQVRRNGRGERGSATLAHLRFRPRFVLENVTPGARSWPAVYRKAG